MQCYPPWATEWENMVQKQVQHMHKPPTKNSLLNKLGLKVVNSMYSVQPIVDKEKLFPTKRDPMQNPLTVHSAHR